MENSSKTSQGSINGYEGRDGREPSANSIELLSVRIYGRSCNIEESILRFFHFFNENRDEFRQNFARTFVPVRTGQKSGKGTGIEYN